MRRISGLSACILFFLSFVTYSNTAFVQRNEVKSFIKTMVRDHHFNEHELTATLNQVQIQPQIIESMDKPYEKKNWDVYRALFLTPERVEGGLAFWEANKNLLNKAQKQYGVPPEIIVAILGVETLYGERQGQYRVLDALATLAFNYPKRAAFFTKELKEYLLLCREHKTAADQYLGSYAGAMGKPQFMPSSYRFYAVDSDNKGVRDLINNNGDVIASVANYFHKHGWKLNEGIVQLAHVRGYGYKRLQTNPRTANYQYSQLQSAGVKPVTAAYHHPARAGLIELVTNKGYEYWMAYPNFFVIERYNSSPQYALVVYLLSQELKARWTEGNRRRQRAYV